MLSEGLSMTCLPEAYELRQSLVKVAQITTFQEFLESSEKEKVKWINKAKKCYLKDVKGKGKSWRII